MTRQEKLKTGRMRRRFHRTRDEKVVKYSQSKFILRVPGAGLQLMTDDP